jgi:hypothetical protein
MDAHMNNLFLLSAAEPVVSAFGHRIVEASSFTQAQPFLKSWERLAESPSEANVFYAPWAVGPALEHLGRDKTSKLLFFVQEGSSEPIVDGVLPLLAKPMCQYLPVYSLHSLRHRYCFSTAPCLRSGRETEVAGSFIQWLHQHRYRYPLVLLSGVTADGAWAQALRQQLQLRRMRFLQGSLIQRALLVAGEKDGQAYLQQTMAGKKLRKYQRLRDSLAEQGNLQVHELQPDEGNLQPWLDAFVALELKGWKGKENTAIGSRPSCRRFFEEMACEAHRRGQLAMLSMTLDDQPLAMVCDFIAAPGAFAFKSAYDEAYARYAPGVLLELENVCRAHDRRDRGLRWLDSCSAPDNELLNRLYLERRSLCNLTISSGHPLANLYVARLPWLKRVQQRLKRS